MKLYIYIYIYTHKHTQLFGICAFEVRAVCELWLSIHLSHIPFNKKRKFHQKKKKKIKFFENKNNIGF